MHKHATIFVQSEQVGRSRMFDICRPLFVSFVVLQSGDLSNISAAVFHSLPHTMKQVLLCYSLVLLRAEIYDDLSEHEVNSLVLEH